MVAMMDLFNMQTLHRRQSDVRDLSLSGHSSAPRLTRAPKQPNAYPPDVSGSNLYSTLVPVLLVSGGMILAFFILRRSQRRQYAPRTFLATLRPQERSPQLSSGFTSWIKEFVQIPDTYVLNHQSIDGYLLLRYLKISTVICLVGCCITFPILFPVDAVNGIGGPGFAQLNRVSILNVPPPNNPKLYAHVFVSWVFFGTRCSQL